MIRALREYSQRIRVFAPLLAALLCAVVAWPKLRGREGRRRMTRAKPRSSHILRLC